MANEFRKVTDQNGVDHPVTDDNRVDWASYAKTGVHNRFNYDSWENIEIINGSGVFENNGVTLTASASDCYTAFGPTAFANCKIPVIQGEKIKLKWNIEEGDSEGRVLLFPNGTVTGFVEVLSTAEKIVYTVPSECEFITFRVGVNNNGGIIHYKNIMVTSADDTFEDYAPYAMTNKELTEKVTPLNTYSYSKRGGTSFKLKGSVSNLGQSYLVMGQLDGRVSVLSIITTNSGSTEALISNIGTAQLSVTYDNTTLETTVTTTANMQNVTVISNENFILS